MPIPDRLLPPLLAWYRRAGRDLPWRRTADPYPIWVSEVMLQQTRVEVVTPYYERFLTAFPTLARLAAAPLDRVLAAWSGLGYYRRARFLHAGARACRDLHRGQVPRDPAAFGALPGVGPYTRAAVMSIAYGHRLAVVDGNVVRVVSRLLALPGEAKSGRLRARVQAAVDRLIPADSPSEFNQAVMELGARVCTPKAPLCATCPVAFACRAFARGEPERWPARAARATPRDVTWQAALIERRGRVLLARRDDAGGRWQGMWELPWGEGEGGEAGEAGASTIREAGERYGLDLLPGAEIGRLRHAVLDERITVVLRAARLARGPRSARASPLAPRFAWVDRSEIGDYALASVWKKALAASTAAAPAAADPPGATPARRRRKAALGSAARGGSRRR